MIERRGGVLDLVRAGDWWQFKLAPALAVFVATVRVARVPLAPLWPSAALLLVALAVCAAYVSLLNDMTDRRDDGESGKRNRQLGRPRGGVRALLAATLAAGAALTWHWRGDVLLAACYAGSWAVFTLYSVPPFRLKSRGLAGLVCDAAGAHLFPALTAVRLVVHGAAPVSPLWTATVAAWVFGYGVRCILLHELLDCDRDRAAGVATFAVRHRAAAVRLGAFVAFPVECGALLAMEWQVGEALPIAALGAYVVVLLWRRRSVRLDPTIVRPTPGRYLLLHEYYDVYLPVALMAAAAIDDWRASPVLVAFLLLFRHAVGSAVREWRWITRAAGVALWVRLRRARARSRLPG